MATKYAGQNALNKLMQLVKSALANKADKTELDLKADKTALDGKLDKTGGTITGNVTVEGSIESESSLSATSVIIRDTGSLAHIDLVRNGDDAASIFSTSETGKSGYARFAVGTPTGDNEAATKAYVDSKVAAGGVTVDDVMSGTSTNPVQNKAVKSYVDTKVSGLQTAINSAISGVYTPKGSIAFASLPTAAAGNKGWVYNVTDAFTTTAAFVEGAGNAYGAGTNVVCVDVGSGSYKWDVLAGTIDLTELTADEVQTLWDSI